MYTGVQRGVWMTDSYVCTQEGVMEPREDA